MLNTTRTNPVAAVTPQLADALTPSAPLLTAPRSDVAALLSRKTLPRIHVLSDIHLESGPYQTPSVLDCDIIVAAGDIGPLELAIPWLAGLGRPVVYVLGNHEYYDRAIDTAVAEARALAVGTNVHVLERESLVIQGVRFLGATLWTSFGSWTPNLAAEAYRKMNDFGYITAGNFLSTAKRQRQFTKLARAANMVGKSGPMTLPKKFHPAMEYMLHEESVAWLERSLAAACSLPTVVVTHHAPAFVCLRKGKNVEPEMLDPANWSRYHRHDKLIYVAAYASDLTKMLRRHQSTVDLWIHGHIHHAQDLMVEGVRVLSNPRGRYVAPLTPEAVRGYALFGFRLSEEDVARSQAVSLAEPYRGEVSDFEPGLVVDLTEGLRRPLEHALVSLRERMQACVTDAALFEPYVMKGRKTQRLASQRCFAYQLADFDKALEALNQTVVSQLDDMPGAYGLSTRLGAPWPPQLPWESSPRTQADFAKALAGMEGWVAYLDRIPHLAAHRLAEWAAQAHRVLQFLETKGLTGVVQRPQFASARRIDCHDLNIFVDQPHDEDALQALEVQLDELVNGRPPREWYLRVKTERTDWYGKPLRSLLTKTQLKAFDRGLSLEIPVRPVVKSAW